MRREMDGTVVLRIYCDLCTAESQPKRGRLGDVTVLTYAPLMTRSAWHAQNPRGDDKNKAGRWAGYTLRDTDSEMQARLNVSERIPGYCRHHGWRTVATADVLAALDARRRTDVLTSRAQG